MRKARRTHARCCYNTYVKLAHTYQEILPQVDAVLRAQSAAMDQELQQRATEYLALSDAHLGTIKSSVLEMMPPFTERESVAQKQLAKSQGGAGAPQVDRSPGGRRSREGRQVAAGSRSRPHQISSAA